MLFWLNPENCIYCLFNTHLRYACQVWGQGNSDRLVMIQRAQNRTIRVINFKGERHPSEPQFTEAKIINHTNIYVCVHDVTKTMFNVTLKSLHTRQKWSHKCIT